MEKTFLFNPDNDMALANGDANYLPPRSARRMAIDLAFLPTWYADDGDAVLIPGSETLYYWSKTFANRIIHPDIKWITDKESVPNQLISPWGWNPALIKQLRLRGLCDDYLPTPENMHVLRQLSGRWTAVEVLNQIMLSLSEVHPLIGKSVVCHTEEDVAREVANYSDTMLKAPWSSSGKGLRRGQGQYVSPLSGWCARTLVQQGAVVVEPLYDKVKDFAMEFYASGDGTPLSFVGYSSFVTDANGAYEGNLLMSDEAIEDELATYVPRETLHAVCTCLQRIIAEHIGNSYQGYVGVDMMVCHAPSSDEGGLTYCLHPCVEINFRMNMGVVAHIFYHRYVDKGSIGRFMVEYYPTSDSLMKAHQARLADYPLILSVDGRIKEGYHPLTPIGRETQYCAWVICMK